MMGRRSEAAARSDVPKRKRGDVQEAEASGDSKGQPGHQQSDAEDQLIAQNAAQVADSNQIEKEAACEQVRSACEQQHALERQQLLEAFESEKASIMKQHEAQLAQAADMKRRRHADSNQFHYIVRGIQEATMSGSVPIQIFDAEPDSVLNHMYNGEWEHAEDDQGRAVVNSDPAHWPLILNWLSYGAVPHHPSPAFLAECRYWNLENLLSTMQQSTQNTGAQSVQLDSPGKHSVSISRISKDGRAGFRLAGLIRNFSTQVQQEINVDFEAFGQKWSFGMDSLGLWVVPPYYPSQRNCHLEVGFGMGSSCYKPIDTDCDLVAPDQEERELLCWETPTGTFWRKAPSPDWLKLENGQTPFDAIQKEPFVDLLGDLQVSVMLLFPRRSAE